MTLTNRLTWFFLTSLGVVLGAFSVMMYTLARTHLLRQLNDRAKAALDTLVAAEVEGDCLENPGGDGAERRTRRAERHVARKRYFNVISPSNRGNGSWHRSPEAPE